MRRVQCSPMPIMYLSDEARRLITVTVTEPYSVDDILCAIDRQASEGKWEYAILYDQRGLTQASADTDLEQIAERVRVAGQGRPRGPVGLAIRAHPQSFLVGLTYSKLTKEFMDVEVLLNEVQLESWLTRNSRKGSRQP
jgi:hypothetical protein